MCHDAAQLETTLIGVPAVTVTAEAVARILESRYDWYSARVKLKEAASAAGVGADGPFDAGQVRSLADALARAGEETIALRLRASVPAKVAVREPVAESPVAEATPIADAASAETPAEDHRRKDGGGRPQKK
jgi:hypothetical protein